MDDEEKKKKEAEKTDKDAEKIDSDMPDEEMKDGSTHKADENK